MTAGDIGTQVQLNTGETGDPSIDYNIPADAAAWLFLAPVTTPPVPMVGYEAQTNANAISATYMMTGVEFLLSGGFYWVQLRIVGPGDDFLAKSALDKKYIDPGVPA